MVLPTLWVTFLVGLIQPGGLPKAQAQSAPTPFDLIGDQTPVSLSGELPAHDATVGRLAGDGGVSGGAASYEIPIVVPPGRRGMQPSLSLGYSSRGGNGIAGMGWSLSGLSSLHRCPHTLEQDGMIRPVTMDPQDKLCLDGQRLVLTGGSYGQAGATYATEMESFARVTQVGGGLGSSAAYFKVERKSGEIAWYGSDADAKATPSGVSVPLSWMLKSVQDRSGNAMHYGYTDYGDGEVLIAHIWYTGTVSTLGTRRVSFTYEDRPITAGNNDRASSYLAGGLTQQTKRLAAVTTFVGSEAVRSMVLTYAMSVGTGRSLLQSASDCAHDSAQWICRPPTQFNWREGAPTYQFKAMPTLTSEDGQLDPTRLVGIGATGDHNGDGTAETVWSQTNAAGNGREQYLVTIGPDRVARQAIRIPDGMWIGNEATDFDMDGKADILVANVGGNNTIRFWRGPINASTFATAFTVSQAVVFPVGPAHLGDMDGDGRADLVGSVENPSGGNACHRLLKVYRNRAVGSGPTATIAFDEIAAHCLAKGDGTYEIESIGRVDDFNGDGLADIWINASGDNFTWGATRLLLGSRPACGSAYCYSLTPTSIASLFPAADPKKSWEIGGQDRSGKTSDGNHIWTDINGDGLTDLLIGSGYWRARLNVGGKFGPHIQFQVPVYRGLELCSRLYAAAPDCGSWIGGYIHPIDYDSDGRQDLLVPRQYAARHCHYLAPVPTDLEPEPTYVCPEAVDGSDDIGPYGTFQGGIQTEVHRMYANALGHFNQSKYYADALKFVETGSNQYRIDIVQTNTIIGPKTTSMGIDLMGDGLVDVTTRFHCVDPFRQCGLPTRDWQGNLLSEYASPRTLPDGTSPRNMRVYLNENLGPGGVLNTDGKSPQTHDVISSVVDGLGNEIGWTYYTLSSSAGRSAGQTPLYTVPSDPAARYIDERHFYFSSSMPVVSEMRRSDGIGGVRTWRYGYGEAMYNAFGRGFQGFRTIIEEDLQGGTRTTTTYYQKFPLTSQPERMVVNPLTRSGEDGALSRTTYDWRCDRSDRANAAACVPVIGTPSRYFPFLDTKRSWTYDASVALSGGVPAITGYNEEIAASDNACSGTVSNVSGYDAWGNLTARTVVHRDLGTGSGGTANRLERQCVSETSTYVVDTSDWWLDKMTARSASTQVVWDGTQHALPSGTSNPVRTVSSSYTWNADRTLSSETMQAGVANQQRVTTYTYPATNGYGQATGVAVAASGDPNGTRSTGTTYTSDGYFPLLVVNALGHHASTQVRARDGQPVSVTDANGLRTLIDYDAFGFATRKRFRGASDGQMVAPDQWTSATWCLSPTCWRPVEQYQLATVQDGAPTRLSRHDAYGRESVTAVKMLDGDWSHVVSEYDTLGRMVWRTEPLISYQTQWYYSTYLYDVLGRMTQKRTPKQHEDGRGDLVTNYSYSGRTTSIQVCGSNDSGTGNCLNLSRTTDSLGRYVETRDAQNGRTRFWYEANGNVAAIEDAVGTVTRASYNAIGQRMSVNDPNQGAWSFVYNALGEVKQQTDARGIATAMHYDVLGRPSSRSASVDVTGDNVADTVLDSWSYDPANAKGAPAQSQRTINGGIERNTTTSYDALARPVQHDIVQALSSGTQSYRLRSQYDSYYGRPVGQESPNGEAVQVLYSIYGHALAEKDPNSGVEYRRTQTVNARGQATQETFGNGVVLDASYQAQTGQLSGLRYSKAGALRSLSYGYDVFGNVKRQSLNGGASREDYQYDSLHRMVSAIRSGAASGTVSYGFDAVGNLKHKSDFSTNTANAYSYTGGSCGGGANAVKTVQLAAGGARTYCYDANGNLTGDNVGLSLSFDHQNMATKAVRGGQTDWFRYGPDGARTRSWGADGSRVYLPGYEHRTDTGETKVYVGDYAVISKSGSTRKVEYLLKDRLGSVDAVANASGTVTETRGYDAFGKPRNGDWTDRTPPKIASTAVTPKGFTQHEHLNQLELIHMNGRVFDYHLGRFTGVDPFIQFPLNSQSLNPYSYILNNPLSGTDPTGYAASCGDKAPLGNGTGTCIGGETKEERENNRDQAKSVCRFNRCASSAHAVNGASDKQSSTGASGRKDAAAAAAEKNSAQTTPAASNVVRGLGALKVVGGVAECAAGAMLCTTGFGCVASVLICGHAADTVTSGGMEVLNGVPHQTLTSQGLEAAGMSREAADFTDAVIGIGNVGAAGAKAAPAAIQGVRGASSAQPLLPLGRSEDIAETATERLVAGYTLWGRASRIGDVYNVDVIGLYSTSSSQGVGKLLSVLREEAVSAGASRIQINGYAVINPGFSGLSSKAAARYGLRVQHLDESTLVLSGGVSR